MMSDDSKTKFSEIPWHVIVGMRNKVIHEYFDIRLLVVWETVQDDIQPLLEQLEAIVSKFDEQNDIDPKNDSTEEH